MPRPRSFTPSYRRHRPTNQAVCAVQLANGGRKDLYLGRCKSARSKEEYARVVALVAANGGISPSAADDVSMTEALVLYTRHINSYYINHDHRPSRSTKNIKMLLGHLTRLFGPTSLADVGPPQLKTIRTVMVGEGKARRSIDKAAGIIRKFVRWCVSEQLVHPSVLESLKAVPPLAPGRSWAVEGKPRHQADPAAAGEGAAAALPRRSSRRRTAPPPRPQPSPGGQASGARPGVGRRP
jgi:hypothetical protein